jgi:hypothetical protein
MVVLADVVVVVGKHRPNRNAWGFMLYVVLEISRPTSTSIVSLSLQMVILFYLYWDMILFIIPRFAEILPCEYARGSGRRFVGEHSLRATAFVECVG